MKEFKITMTTNDGEEVGVFFIPEVCVPSDMTYEDFVKQFEDTRKIITLNTSAIKAGIYPRFLGVGMNANEDELIDFVRTGHLPFEVYLEVTTNPVMIQAREKMKEYKANHPSGNYGAAQGVLDVLPRDRDELEHLISYVLDYSHIYHNAKENAMRKHTSRDENVDTNMDELNAAVGEVHNEQMDLIIRQWRNPAVPAKPEETFIDRLHREKNELSEKIAKLDEFLNGNPIPENVSQKQVALMTNQFNHMCEYYNDLRARLEDLGEQFTSHDDIVKEAVEGEIDYDELAAKFKKDDSIISLKTGKPTIYSGFLTIVGLGIERIGYDSFNKDLVLYKEGKIAELSGAVKGEPSIKDVEDREVIIIDFKGKTEFIIEGNYTIQFSDYENIVSDVIFLEVIKKSELVFPVGVLFLENESRALDGVLTLEEGRYVVAFSKKGDCILLNCSAKE